MSEDSSKHMLANEHEIVEKAKTDDKAFETLYEFYFPKIYNYVYKRVGNRETAEDIVSTTFMKVFSNMQKYDYKGHTFGAWVYRIATNNLIDYYRKQGRRKEVSVEKANEIVDSKASPNSDYEKGENRELIQNIIKKLPNKYQEILHLRFFAEMSNQEIADVLGVSANNANVLVFRATKKFYKLYISYER